MICLYQSAMHLLLFKLKLKLKFAGLYTLLSAHVSVVHAGFDTSQKMNRSVVPIGRPIDNVRMYVLDAKMKPLPVGVPGELMISSHQVARGYLKRPDENAKTFVDNPYGQGDYARMYRTGECPLLAARFLIQVCNVFLRDWQRNCLMRPLQGIYWKSSMRPPSCDQGCPHTYPCLLTMQRAFKPCRRRNAGH